MIYRILSSLINFFEMAIILQALLTWFPIPQNYMGLVRALDSLVEPILKPIQKFLYKHFDLGRIDISPIVAIFLLSAIKRLLFIVLW